MDKLEIDENTEVDTIKDHIYNLYCKPYNLELQTNAISALDKARILNGDDKIKMLIKAWDKAEITYLAAWASGKIKVAVVKMPDDVKEKLKELTKAKQEEKRILREQQEKAELARQARLAQPTEKISTIAPKIVDETHKINNQQPKRIISKLSIYNDPARQAEICSKYIWVIPGSFRPDPHKPNGTILDIKCQKCGSKREIHSADAFQCKLCVSCKLLK